MADRVLTNDDDDDGFGYSDLYDPDGLLGEQLTGQATMQLRQEPSNPYERGIDAHSKDSKQTEGGTATKADKDDRDSTINTDGTTHQEVLLGLQSSTVSGSGGIPTSINVNYSEQAQNTIRQQGWSVAKLKQRVKDLQDHVEELKVESDKEPRPKQGSTSKQPGTSRKSTSKSSLQSYSARRKKKENSKKTAHKNPMLGNPSQKAEGDPVFASFGKSEAGDH